MCTKTTREIRSKAENRAGSTRMPRAQRQTRLSGTNVFSGGAEKLAAFSSLLPDPASPPARPPHPSALPKGPGAIGRQAYRCAKLDGLIRPTSGGRRGNRAQLGINRRRRANTARNQRVRGERKRREINNRHKRKSSRHNHLLIPQPISPRPARRSSGG